MGGVYIFWERDGGFLDFNEGLRHIDVRNPALSVYTCFLSDGHTHGSELDIGTD